MPAAFRRLCVETNHGVKAKAGETQPPSGGCVLKQAIEEKALNEQIQPPSGGCVLKRATIRRHGQLVAQPPSGGCVLKQIRTPRLAGCKPAAFRRLCVETINLNEWLKKSNQPPSGGCVLKLNARAA